MTMKTVTIPAAEYRALREVLEHHEELHQVKARLEDAAVTAYEERTLSEMTRTKGTKRRR